MSTVLDEYRGTAEPYLDGLARVLRHTHPDTVTWVALLCALGAGVSWGLLVIVPVISAIGMLLVFLGGLLVGLNGIFDALDGKLARHHGISSRRGDFLDHILDRYADLAILGGLTLGTLSSGEALGVLAILGVLLSSYMGTQAQAVGVGRNYKGMLGRADRLMLLIILAFAQLTLLVAAARVELGPTLTYGVLRWTPTVMDIGLVILAVGGQATAVQRAAATWEELSRREAGGTSELAAAQRRLAEAEQGLTAAKEAVRTARAASRSRRAALAKRQRDALDAAKADEQIQRERVEAAPRGDLSRGPR